MMKISNMSKKKFWLGNENMSYYIIFMKYEWTQANHNMLSEYAFQWMNKE